MRPFRASIGMVILLAGACADSDEPAAPVVAGGATQAPAPASESKPAEIVVTDANGMTVYYFIKDTPNRSHCLDECSSKYWFPVRPQPGLEGSNFTVFTRPDGTQQLAYNGRPLYTYHRDSKPGDMKGDGQRGRWFALRF